MDDRGKLIARIHGEVRDLVEAIAAGKPPHLETKSLSSARMCLVQDEEGASFSLQKSEETSSTVTKNLRGITSILLVLKFVLRLLRENKTSTRKTIRPTQSAEGRSLS